MALHPTKSSDKRHQSISQSWPDSSRRRARPIPTITSALSHHSPLIMTILFNMNKSLSPARSVSALGVQMWWRTGKKIHYVTLYNLNELQFIENIRYEGQASWSHLEMHQTRWHHHELSYTMCLDFQKNEKQMEKTHLKQTRDKN